MTMKPTNVRLLQIDNSEAFLSETKKFLEKESPILRVTSETNPEEALKLLKEHNYDCIVSEYYLGDTTGLELVREIRKFSDASFIIYTEKNLMPIIQEVYDAGVDDHVVKDVSNTQNHVLLYKIKASVERNSVTKFYREIFEHSMDAILLLRGTTIINGNRAAAEIYEIEKPELLFGTDILNILVDKEGIKKKVERRQTGFKAPDNYVTELIVGDKIKKIYVTSTAVNFFGETLSFCLIRDITEIDHMRQELVESEKKYRTLIEQSNDSVLVLIGTRIVFANKYAAVLHGFDDPSELLGHDIREFSLEEQCENIRQEFERYQAGEPIPPTIEGSIIRRDGEERNVLFKMNKVKWDGQDAFLSYAHDITDLKKMELALREAITQLENITKTIPDTIIFLDKNLEVRYFSQPEQMSRTTESLGRKGYLLHNQDRIEEIRELMEKVLKTGQPATYETIYENSNGGEGYYEARLSPLINEGEIDGLVISIRDMTERVDNERKRLQLERTLFAERIKTEQLEEINKAKSSFMATATHEIRTPVTAILGFTEIIEEMLQDEDYETALKQFGVLKRNINRLINLTDELLDAQRVQLDRYDLNYSSITVNDILDNVESEFAPRVAEKKQILRVNRLKHDEVIEVDVDRLFQVFGNIISNSSKFSPENTTITVDTEMKKEKISFTITDDGIGMTPEEMEQLFIPFPDITPKVAGKGSGLGLYICKEIVKKHGGDITATSKGQDKGTVFTFIIRRHP